MLPLVDLGIFGIEGFGAGLLFLEIELSYAELSCKWGKVNSKDVV